MSNKMSNNDGCCVKESSVAFDEILRELAVAVDVAASNADLYRNKIGKLDHFELECETCKKMASDCKEAEPPDTVLYKLRMIVNQLGSSNQKNSEILQHLSTLV
jgi:hypothetical protein